VNDFVFLSLLSSCILACLGILVEKLELYLPRLDELQFLLLFNIREDPLNLRRDLDLPVCYYDLLAIPLKTSSHTSAIKNPPP